MFRLAYAFGYGTLGRLALRAYLATLGSDKVGFTVTDRDAQGQPVYVGGVRGIVERNAVRYTFAVQAFLETRALPPAERFEASLERWFELTERFPRQLHEVERADYLADKRRERENQHALQRAIDRGEAGAAAARGARVRRGAGGA